MTTGAARHVLWAVALTLSIALLGCEQWLRLEAAASPDGSHPSMDPVDGGRHDGEPCLPCESEFCSLDPGSPDCIDTIDIGDGLGRVHQGTTLGAGDDAWPVGCRVGYGTEDVALSWTAPASGVYRFDTRGSELSTVLSLFDGPCDRRELACNASDDRMRASIERVALGRGESVLLLVEGKQEGTAGRFEVHVSGEMCDNGRDDDGDMLADCADPKCGDSVACPRACLPDGHDSWNGRVLGTLAGNGDQQVAVCGDREAASEELALRFVAPRNGRYRFSSAGSDVETHVFVRDQGCGGALLGCRTGATDVGARMHIPLVEGQAVVVGIEGRVGAGVFSLHVNPGEVCEGGDDEDRDGLVDCADPDCAVSASCPDACVDVDVGCALGMAASGGTGVHDRFQPSCYDSFGGETVYRWMAPRTGRYRFQTRNAAPTAPVLYVLEDSCLGRELACHTSVTGDTSVDLPAREGQRLLVVVDTLLDRGVSYDLEITEL